MNKEEFIKDLEELTAIIQSRIDKCVAELRYEESAFYRDVKKDVEEKIKTLKSE
ncbi:MAG: hypothetical protein K0B10_01310 [Vicingaceae bacterium]|nr:hypothetical protein [Vicingaceae bacterium]